MIDGLCTESAVGASNRRRVRRRMAGLRFIRRGDGRAPCGSTRVPYLWSVLRCSFTLPRGILNVTDAKTTLSRLINKIQIEADHATPVVIGRHGEPMAVVISLEQFEEYHALATLAIAQTYSLPPKSTGDGLRQRRDPGRGGSAGASGSGSGDRES